MTPTRDPVDEAVRHWAERRPESARFRALTSMVRAYSVVTREIEAVLQGLELNLSRFEILLVLSFSRRGSLPASRLRDALMIHGSSVTYLLDRLEAAGLVARAPDPEDRRVVRIALTDAGRDTLDRACALLVEGGFGAFASVPEERLEVLSDVLNELRGGANGT
ncbi:MAG: MarR family transcriptional regulator [Actinomycetota bacterium]